MKLHWLGVILLAISLSAQSPVPKTPADQIPHGSILPLWEGQTPGAVGTTEEDKPHLEFSGAAPDAKLKDGSRTAVIVCQEVGILISPTPNSGSSVHLVKHVNVPAMTAWSLYSCLL